KSRRATVGNARGRKYAANLAAQASLIMSLSQLDGKRRCPTEPSFRRRALALGEYHGKVYTLGGMQEQGGPTTTVYVHDLTTGNWSQGPKLPVEGLQGFGGSAVDCARRLYTTTYSGKLSCLSADGKEWRGVGQLTRARFFHRLLCSGDSSLIALGGGNMEEGKDPSVEVVRLAGSQ
ncbi:MAG TPA: kelch repeat-containing protein, partial [Planctomycetaceae bacterium]|nr:kelch repeat-containing protein [Planctomycetaceae bacterium]